MTATEARYYRASRGCHRAWVTTQPQLVLEGVLEEVDVARADGKPPIGRLSGVSAAASASSSAALAPLAILPGRGRARHTPKGGQNDHQH